MYVLEAWLLHFKKHYKAKWILNFSLYKWTLVLSYSVSLKDPKSLEWQPVPQVLTVPPELCHVTSEQPAGSQGRSRHAPKGCPSQMPSLFSPCGAQLPLNRVVFWLRCPESESHTDFKSREGNDLFEHPSSASLHNYTSSFAVLALWLVAVGNSGVALAGHRVNSSACVLYITMLPLSQASIYGLLFDLK